MLECPNQFPCQLPWIFYITKAVATGLSWSSIPLVCVVCVCVPAGACLNVDPPEKRGNSPISLDSSDGELLISVHLCSLFLQVTNRSVRELGLVSRQPHAPCVLFVLASLLSVFP